MVGILGHDLFAAGLPPGCEDHRVRDVSVLAPEHRRAVARGVPHVDRARRRRVSPSGSDGFGHGACVVLLCQFAVRGHALLDLAAQ